MPLINGGSDFDKLLNALESKKDEVARDNMLSPKRDLFEHGVQVGIYRGLSMVEPMLSQILKEDLKDD